MKPKQIKNYSYPYKWFSRIQTTKNFVSMLHRCIYGVILNKLQFFLKKLSIIWSQIKYQTIRSEINFLKFLTTRINPQNWKKNKVELTNKNKEREKTLLPRSMPPFSTSFLHRGWIRFIGVSCLNLFYKGAAGSKNH